MKNTVKKMKFMAGALVLLSMAAAQAEPMIDSSKAAFFVGTEAMVCGTVNEVKPFSKGTYLNMGAKYPSQHISVLIWTSDEQGFNARFGGLSAFQGKQVCARGLIENYKSTLQIKVSNPQFLRLMQ
jgi:hypothetical protein